MSRRLTEVAGGSALLKFGLLLLFSKCLYSQGPCFEDWTNPISLLTFVNQKVTGVPDFGQADRVKQKL